MRRSGLDSFTGFSKIPGFELHNEGRSYLTRTGEHFDLIQASLVDRWAATSAGAMTLSENALTRSKVGRSFYEHLKPGGIMHVQPLVRLGGGDQTLRLLAVAKAMMLQEGVAYPETQLATALHFSRRQFRSHCNLDGHEHCDRRVDGCGLRYRR